MRSRGISMAEDESILEKLVGKGRITAWVALGGLFTLIALGAVPAEKALELVGYIIMTVVGAEAGARVPK